MTENQKYSEILEWIGELLKIKNDEIAILKYQVKDLTDRLLEAERFSCNKKFEKIETR